MKTWNNTTRHVLGHVLVFIVVFAIAVAAVMFLWNAILPPLTGWASISYGQSAGLMVLGRLLTGEGLRLIGFFLNPGGRRQREHLRFRERLRRMSQEERREFIRRRMSGPEDTTDTQQAKE